MRLYFFTTFILLLIGSSYSSYAQITFSGLPKGAKVPYLSEIKELKNKIATEKQRILTQKQEIENKLKAYRSYQKRYDSLKSVYKDSLSHYKDSVSQLKSAKKSFSKEKLDSLKTNLSDSITFFHTDSLKKELQLSKEDSLKLVNKAKSYLPAEYQKYAPDSLKWQKIDSTGLKLAEDRLQQLLQEKMGKGIPQSQLQDVGNMKMDGLGVSGNELSKMKLPNPNLVGEKEAQELFKKVKPEAFAKAQKNVQKLKNKYASVANSNDLKNEVKRSSLKGVPFKKRLKISGNLGIPSLDPVAIDFSMELGYKLSKKWQLGLGFSIKERFEVTTDTLKITHATGGGYGYRTFINYSLKQFFFRAEGSMQRAVSLFGNSEQKQSSNNSNSWHYAPLIGVGRAFKVGKATMQTMVLYNFNRKTKPVAESPWVFRIGFGT